MTFLHELAHGLARLKPGTRSAVAAVSAAAANRGVGPGAASSAPAMTEFFTS